MPNAAFDVHPDNYRTLTLFLFTISNYALMYLANIILARTLSISGYDDYSVAVSIVTMLSTISTLGLEKYALRAVALFSERQDFKKFHGFWLFSIKTILSFSVFVVALLCIVLETILAFQHADYHIAIVLYAVFLPVITLTLFQVEFISAQGRHLLGVSIYRVFLPLVYLIFILAGSHVDLQLTASTSVLSLGAAWTITLVLISFSTKLITPHEIKKAEPLIFREKWLKRSLPLVFNSLMLTVITSSGVVILELIFPSGLEVGIYAVAAQTGGFISLIGTSTNRYYLPMMVVLVERREKQAIQRLIHQRALIIGLLIFMLFVAFVVFGQSLLDLFGHRFNEGYLTLVTIAVGASISALFADMPYYLQYMGFNRTVLCSTLVATFSMLSLSFILGREYGTLGVASAYSLSVFLLFISFRVMVTYLFKKL